MSNSGGQHGDLYIKTTVAKHPVFDRKDNDLLVETNVNIFTALLGGKIKIPTLAGEKVITVPSHSDSGKIFRLKGLGMPFYDNNTISGDLLVKIKLVTPKNLSLEDTKILENLITKYNFND